MPLVSNASRREVLQRFSTAFWLTGFHSAMDSTVPSADDFDFGEDSENDDFFGDVYKTAAAKAEAVRSSSFARAQPDAHAKVPKKATTSNDAYGAAGANTSTTGDGDGYLQVAGLTTVTSTPKGTGLAELEPEREGWGRVRNNIAKVVGDERQQVKQVFEAETSKEEEETKAKAIKDAEDQKALEVAKNIAAEIEEEGLRAAAAVEQGQEEGDPALDSASGVSTGGAAGGDLTAGAAGGTADGNPGDPGGDGEDGPVNAEGDQDKADAAAAAAVAAAAEVAQPDEAALDDEAVAAAAEATAAEQQLYVYPADH